MPKMRREFSSEFKREAVALLESSGRPLMQVATKVGISPSMLRSWRALVHGGTARPRAATSTVSPMPSPADQASEITRLKRELDRTRMERDVLKTYGPPRPQEDCRLATDGSASTYTACRR